MNDGWNDDFIDGWLPRYKRRDNWQTMKANLVEVLPWSTEISIFALSWLCPFLSNGFMKFMMERKFYGCDGIFGWPVHLSAFWTHFSKENCRNSELKRKPTDWVSFMACKDQIESYYKKFKQTVSWKFFSVQLTTVLIETTTRWLKISCWKVNDLLVWFSYKTYWQNFREK